MLFTVISVQIIAISMILMTSIHVFIHIVLNSSDITESTRD